MPIRRKVIRLAYLSYMGEPDETKRKIEKEKR